MKLCWTYCKVKADFPTPPSPKTTILYLRTPPVAEAVADPSSCSFMDCISAVECFMEDTLFTGVGVQALLQVLLLVSEADMLRKVTAAAATLEDVC